MKNENLEKKLKEWLDTKRYLTKENNYYVYEYDKSYDDYISQEDVKKILEGKTKEERQDNYYSLIYDEGWFYDFENETIRQLASDFCFENDYEETDTEIEDILVNIISFSYDTYLDEEYNVNILIDFNNQDSNYDLSTSSNLDYCKHNNLYTLLRKQGYTKKDYLNNLKKLVKKDKYNYDYDLIVKNGGSKFLTSVKEEIDNNCYECVTTLVVLKKMTLRDLIECENIVVNTDNMIGLFNYFQGSGSLLEIQLEKDFTINREKDIYKIQVEGTGSSYDYTVNDVYGLIDSCWKE